MSFFLAPSLSLRHVVEEFEARLTAGSKSHNMVRAVDNKFRKAIQEQQVRLTKVLDIIGFVIIIRIICETTSIHVYGKVGVVYLLFPHPLACRAVQVSIHHGCL